MYIYIYIHNTCIYINEVVNTGFPITLTMVKVRATVAISNIGSLAAQGAVASGATGIICIEKLPAKIYNFKTGNLDKVRSRPTMYLR